MIWSLVAAVVLVLANGFFVAYEFALIVAKRSDFEASAASGNAAAKAALHSFQDLSAQLAGAQLGITMASLGLGYVGEPVLGHLFESWLEISLSTEVSRILGFVLALFVVSFLHLVIGEMVPKNIAIAAPATTMRWLVLPYKAYLAPFRPVIAMVNWLANAGVRAFGIEPRDELVASHSLAELASIVSVSQHHGAIEADNAGILQGALAFAERPVIEVARPIADVVTLRHGSSVSQAERVVRQTGERRLLVEAPSLGSKRFVGYRHVKDLLGVDDSMRISPMTSDDIRQLAQVSADQSLVEVLRTMRRLKRQLALVVRDGEPVGLVSVEEVIRALIPKG